MSDFDACAEGIRKVKAAVGPIEILVNNAGIVRDGALHKMTRTQWDAVIATNLNALFNMCRQVIEGIPARKFGRIINISSINDTEIDPRARAKLLRRRSLEHRVGAVQKSRPEVPGGEHAETNQGDRALHMLAARFTGGISPIALSSPIWIGPRIWRRHRSGIWSYQTAPGATRQFLEHAAHWFAPGHEPWSLIKPQSQDR